MGQGAGFWGLSCFSKDYLSIPVNSAGHSDLNRPPNPEQIGRGRSGATQGYFSVLFTGSFLIVDRFFRIDSPLSSIL